MPQSELPVESVIDSVDRDFWDRMGMSLSGICVIHCLALPVVVSLLPMWSAAVTLHAWLHPLFAVLLVPTTIIAGMAGYRRHRNAVIAGVLALGLIIILATGVALHDQWGSTREIVWTTVGSIILIAGHLMNWRARHHLRTSSGGM